MIARRSRSVVVALCFVGHAALAQEGGNDVGGDADDRARRFFAEGRTLLEQGRPDEACIAFEASRVAEETLATLLNLGLCHRRAGRLATALDHYRRAEHAADEAGDTERRALAAEQTAELERLVGRVTVGVLDPGDERLIVSLDGAVLPRARWDSSMPMDAGPHVVQAVEPGRRAWTGSVTVHDGGSYLVAVPPLPSSRAPSPEGRTPERLDGAPAMSTERVFAIACGGIAATAFGLAIGFTVSAVSKYDGSGGHCSATNVCDAEGLEARQSASTAATRATVASAVGGAAVLGGISFWILGAPRGAESTRPQVRIGARGLLFSGAF